MACSIEMLRCDRCGDEVERYEIRVRRNEEGEREWLCPACAGEERAVQEEAPAAPVDCT